MSAVATQEKSKGTTAGGTHGSAVGGTHQQQQQQQQRSRPRFKSFLSHLRHRKPSTTHLKSEPVPAAAAAPAAPTTPAHAAEETTPRVAQLPADSYSHHSTSNISRQGTAFSTASSSMNSSSTSLDADTDASIRPITPGSSHRGRSSTTAADSASSISNLSNNTQARSTASTKPTTLFSVHSDHNGANRIAQSRSAALQPLPTLAPTPSSSTSTAAPPPHSPSAVLRRQGSDMTSRSTAASIQFSALPPTPGQAAAPSTNPSSYNNSTALSSTPPASARPLIGQAPYFSNPHPRNNPHPSSPALDNASMVTLASSTHPGLADERSNDRMSVIADEDASVRALPPSRRASDGSLASKMSGSVHAGVGGGGASSSHWNASNKRPASLLTVATGASDLKWERERDRDSTHYKRKSTATNYTDAGEDGLKEDLAPGAGVYVAADEDTEAELKTAPTSPAVTENAPDPMQSVNPSHLPGTPETEEPPAVNGSDSNGKPKIGLKTEKSPLSQSSTPDPPASAQTEKAPTVLA